MNNVCYFVSLITILFCNIYNDSLSKHQLDSWVISIKKI